LGQKATNGGIESTLKCCKLGNLLCIRYFCCFFFNIKLWTFCQYCKFTVATTRKLRWIHAFKNFLKLSESFFIFIFILELFSQRWRSLLIYFLTVSFFHSLHRLWKFSLHVNFGENFFFALSFEILLVFCARSAEWCLVS
jgi:hypothetical protein